MRLKRAGYPAIRTVRSDQTAISRVRRLRLVNRVLGRIPSAEHLHDDMIVWRDNSDKSAWYYADVQEATNSHYYEKNGEYEVWTAIRETRNWTELERR